ncbi:MAG TPA: Rne/Rng family ribonuclease [Candidatus Cybelea sp.]|nr:Rne/Rng family ribonuclease [Candidatus Cybelea sp.]
MSSEILISSDPWENRVAILEDGGLAELYIEREEKVIGSIYKGKVQNVLPGMGAAFVDIGLGRNAFLYVDDINKQPLNIGDVEITQGHGGFTISEKVKRGDDVLVQIVKEPRGLKGARISTNISLPGRYLILMPTGKYSGVSRKIESAQERNRLSAVMKRIRPEGMATVVRTAAAGVGEAELIADLGVLIRMWHGILERYKRAASPSLLHKDMNLIYKAARDFITADVDRVLIDDEEEFRKIRDLLQLLGPQYIDRIEYYNSGRSLFDDFHIEAELQKLMKPKINLPSGASIVIESTEALTVIDVNSGKFTGGRNLEDTILKTNIEAAEEIARQVRLRDIGGIIVVDFIDMASEASQEKVVKTMEESLRRDRTRATIQSFSNLGLLEFTRKRIGKDLGAQLRGSCPTCAGMGSVMSPQSVAIETFRHIRSEASDGAAGDVVAHVAPTVAVQMDFWYKDECSELAEAIHHPIHVRVDPMIHPEKSRVETGRNGKPERERPVRVGDEHEVELLTGRLPNPTSAAAIVDGRVAEVENAANNAGNFVRIRILDVDDKDDAILAELVMAGAKSRRKRGARKAEPSAAEQTRQLRELAEDAARHSASRPPIGISSLTEEEEAQDKALSAERRGEAQPDAIVIVEGAVQHAVAEGDGRRSKRRRRRRRGRGGREEGDEVTTVAATVAATGAAPVTMPAVAPAVVPAPSGDAATGEGQHRRRRRRRRGRGGRGGAQSGAMPERHIFEVGADGGAAATGATAPPEPMRAIARRAAATPAVEPPPPSLSAPQEEPKRTKPARRRTGTRAASGELTKAADPIALPAPEKKATRGKPAPAEKPAPSEKAAPARKRAATPRKKAATAAKPAAEAKRAAEAKAPAEKPKRAPRPTAKAGTAAAEHPTRRRRKSATEKES